MTEIRQASPFSETKTVTRAPTRTARETSPVFELPDAERAIAARSDQARSIASARNAERDAARAADKNDKLPKAPSAKAGHSHAHEGVRGAKRQVDVRAAEKTDRGLDQADTEYVTGAKATEPQDVAVTSADDSTLATGETASVEAAALGVEEQALVQLQARTIPLATAIVPETSDVTVQPVVAASSDQALAGTTVAAATLLAAMPPASLVPANDKAVVPVEAAQAAVAVSTLVSPKFSGVTVASGTESSVDEKAEDVAAGETGKSDQPAKATGDAKPVAGKAETDQQIQAADGKPAPESKTPVDVPAVARDVRFELPPGFSIAAPKAAHDLHGVSGPEQVPNGLPQAAEGRPTPLNAVPLEIGLRAMAGNRRFDIRLDPAELGRVDVRLEIDDAGTVTAKLTVDRVETLQLLQRDARTLERAFEQAGLKPSDGGVDISLRDQSGQQGSSQAGRDSSEQNTRRSRAFIHVEPEIAEAQGIRRAVGPGRIDLII